MRLPFRARVGVLSLRQAAHDRPDGFRVGLILYGFVEVGGGLFHAVLIFAPLVPFVEVGQRLRRYAVRGQIVATPDEPPYLGPDERRTVPGVYFRNCVLYGPGGTFPRVLFRPGGLFPEVG